MRLILLIAILLILTIVLTKYTYVPGTGEQTAEFAGVWVERSPAIGHAMRVKFTPRGSQLAVYLSYTQIFQNDPFSVATIKDYKATFIVRGGCGKMHQTPGYSYDNPGESVWSFSLEKTSGGGSSRRLFHTVVTRWTAPCGGHPIGTERTTKNS